MEAAAPGGPAHDLRVDPRHGFGTFTEAHGTTAIVWLSGDCDAAAAPRLRATLEPLIHNDMRRIRIDMREVTFFDSVALSVVLEAQAQLPPGGHLELAQPSLPAARLLHTAGFDGMVGDADGHLLNRAELEQRIDRLTEPQRKILSAYFGERQPIGDVAAALHMSIRQAEQLLTETLDVLEIRRPPIGG